jgi:aminoglycoside phosphotransferase
MIDVTMLAAAVDVVASRWGAVIAVHEVLVDHQDRAVLRCVDPVGRPVVVKADRDVRRLEREAKALTAAALAGVSVPAVYERILGQPPAILIMAYVEGEPLCSTSPQKHWRAVAWQLRRLHDHAVPDGLPMFGGGTAWWERLRWLADWSGQWCRDRRLVAPGVLDRLQASMSTAFARDDEPTACLLHGDCGPYHWLLRQGTVAAVVDFGDAGSGDAVWDLAVLTLWDRHRLAVVLDGYRADETMRGRVDTLFRPYTVLRHLLGINWLVEHGHDPTPTVAELQRLAS